MSLHDCRKCGAYCVTDRHICPPRFVVWCPELGAVDAEDGRTFHAHSPGDAAREWAQWEDSSSADYTIVKGHDMTVHVQAEDGGPVVRFIVSGETVAHYTARVIATAGEGRGDG